MGKRQDIEIKIDRTTLPKDGQKVSFEDEDLQWHKGIFRAGDDLFVVNSRKWFRVWDVIRWEPIVTSKNSKK